VSRLIRVRYGNLELFKRLPQGAWIELDIENVNSLRKMVQLPVETESKIHTPETLDHTKLSRMRRSVRKHKQNKVSGQRSRRNQTQNR
jgi:23S rRNA pseudouridine2605 synthase